MTDLVCKGCDMPLDTATPHRCAAKRTLPLPLKPTRPVRESDILRKIREAVGKMDGVVLWRNNTGMLEDRNGTKVRFGLCEGSADLVGMVRVTACAGIARFFAMEVKQPGKKPTPKQVAFLKLVNDMGGYGCWVDSVENAVELVGLARIL